MEEEKTPRLEREYNNSTDDYSRSVGIAFAMFILCKKISNHSAEKERMAVKQESNNDSKVKRFLFDASSTAQTQSHTCTDSESAEPEKDISTYEKDRRRNGFIKFVVHGGRSFAATLFFLELLSIILDQLSSPHDSNYALAAMVVSFTSMVLCIIEIVNKGRNQKAMWRRGRNIKTYWFHHPTDGKPFGNLLDILGLVSSILEFIMASITAAFHVQQKNNPIKIPIRSIIFAVYLLFSKFPT